jgi:hypothetical protein
MRRLEVLDVHQPIHVYYCNHPQSVL